MEIKELQTLLTNAEIALDEWHRAEDFFKESEKNWGVSLENLNGKIKLPATFFSDGVLARTIIARLEDKAKTEMTRAKNATKEFFKI